MDRAEAVGRLVPVFRRYGYEGATLARISEATGLGRASLYHHFPKGKQEMAAAVLAYVNQWFKVTILDPLCDSGQPIERLEAMTENLQTFYRSGRDSCLLSIFSLGEANDLFHDHIHQALSAWISALAAIVTESGVAATIAHQRAEEAVMLVQGALILARGLDDVATFERAVRGLPTRLLTSAPPAGLPAAMVTASPSQKYDCDR
ncbi:MAG: TetR/AcrR family transcriptional regulator [Thermosynechococcaceae cyanobacterium]